MKYRKIMFSVVGFALALVGLGGLSSDVSAFSVTPMKQTITLQPGDTYSGRVSSFVMNEGNGGKTTYYEAWVAPLTVDDVDNHYTGVFNKANDWTDIVNWTTISDGDETAKYDEKVTGVMEPGEMVDFTYAVNVPEDARGGGQYFAIVVQQIPDPNAKNEGNVGIADYIQIASVVYAEVAGDINISGSITNNNIPGFLLNPPITASFLATNSGNTHSEVTYYMQVFPLFSGEEIYTTEENPTSDYVLPGTTRYVHQTWEDTPSVGIFRVKQTVYYDSLENEPSVTEKVVIVCPIWLLFIIFFVIAAIIIWLVMRVRGRRQAAKRKTTHATEAKDHRPETKAE
ncbi:hypothetical protein IKG05_00370 [Candidatus Saccharibacteria bacterium]|nr:hypothetical protein [Candidatus Saccharibacteria bacterium]